MLTVFSSEYFLTDSEAQQFTTIQLWVWILILFALNPLIAYIYFYLFWHVHLFSTIQASTSVMFWYIVHEWSGSIFSASRIKWRPRPDHNSALILIPLNGSMWNKCDINSKRASSCQPSAEKKQPQLCSYYQKPPCERKSSSSSNSLCMQQKTKTGGA